MKYLKLLLFIFSPIILQFSVVQAQEQNITGVVYSAEDRQPLAGVSVVSGIFGTSTDEQGKFSLVIGESDSITVMMIGYQDKVIHPESLSITIYLNPKILGSDPIEVVATRVIPGVTPVAYSTLDKSEISDYYNVQDVPMVLSYEPGVHAYSESGNGTGYSYVSIRGFDQSRIAVMIDNVPLNDNENHEVYWVDHGDLLVDAADIEIQRGIGNSLYGSAAFGGSINVQTQINPGNESFGLSISGGSYNTYKGNFRYRTGSRLGDNFGGSIRISTIHSDGYRTESTSDQRTIALGIEHNAGIINNQLRVLIGKEISRLQWDGISADRINDRKLRKGKMSWTQPFTDDFLQQIYSLNTKIKIGPHLRFRNVLYGVFGSGFYEVDKMDVEFYEYNLDTFDFLPPEPENGRTTDLTRRKWIVNQYFGFVPTVTYRTDNLRTDVGMEWRSFFGSHFGEIFNFSDSSLNIGIRDKYRYYDYDGNKRSISIFGHMIYSLPYNLHVMVDLQYQQHSWNLDQVPLGNFSGFDLSADWTFINPRLGINYLITDNFSMFVNYGTAEKEPADNQILEADDVWAAPRAAASERISDIESGFHFIRPQFGLKINLYRIDYDNEILSDIYDFAEGEFDIETADRTRHEGIEIEGDIRINEKTLLTLNGSISSNTFISGENKGKVLINVPDRLLNIQAKYQLTRSVRVFGHVKYVGRQFIDYGNTAGIAIDPYTIMNLSVSVQIFDYSAKFMINNIFDTLYETYGYEYWGAYYWPGATRNFIISLSRSL
ncbi:MAG: TonB-dependent receptor [Candidatus Neomarinimicrobiota bacterium]